LVWVANVAAVLVLLPVSAARVVVGTICRVAPVPAKAAATAPTTKASAMESEWRRRDNRSPRAHRVGTEVQNSGADASRDGLRGVRLGWGSEHLNANSGKGRAG